MCTSTSFTQQNGGIKQIALKNISAPELKVLIVFIYFFIFGVVSMIAFTIATQTVTDFISELTVYFVCESQGVQPGRTCERGFVKEQTQSEVALAFVYILMGFYPVVNLVYVVNFQEVKERFKSKWLDKRSSCNKNPGTALASDSKASI